MLRTQISLDRDMYRRVKSEARRHGISVAELLRRALASTLHPAVSANKPWMRFAGTLESRDATSSRSVDAVVYGRGRP
jgi:negative regulator of replication initiation